MEPECVTEYQTQGLTYVNTSFTTELNPMSNSLFLIVLVAILQDTVLLCCLGLTGIQDPPDSAFLAMQLWWARDLLCLRLVNSSASIF